MRLCSHWQQSLHRWHFGQRWLSQTSLVQYTQISVEGSSQMLHAKVVVSLTIPSSYLALVFLFSGAAGGREAGFGDGSADELGLATVPMGRYDSAPCHIVGNSRARSDSSSDLSNST